MFLLPRSGEVGLTLGLDSGLEPEEGLEPGEDSSEKYSISCSFEGEQQLFRI
jgi:hypothetical protein